MGIGTPRGPWCEARYEGSFQPFPYTMVDRTPLGRYVVERATLATPEGASPYSVVHCKPCACVLIVLGQKVLLVRQYRYAVGSWQDELVAGGIESGESPREAALREMREETGFVVDPRHMVELSLKNAASWDKPDVGPGERPLSEVVSLGAFFPSGGSSDEIMHLFAIRLPEGATAQGTHFDKGERTERILLSRHEMEQRMLEGSLTHAAIYVAWERLRLCGLLDAWLPLNF